MQPSEMASLSSSRWESRKERQNRSTSNIGMNTKDKRTVSEGGSEFVISI